MGDYIEQEKVVNSSWVGVKEVRIILPIGISKAKEIVRDISNEMKEKKEFYFNTKPRLIPTKKIIEKYNIDTDTIRREAKRIRRI